MRGSSDYQFIVEIKAETDKALLVDHGGKSEVWIPKSQIRRREDDLHKENISAITVPEWLAEAKGLL